jgi:redox-sensitive bicupin YhaK (pirin superfamily)
VHFFQIWILPQDEEIAPGYEQRLFPEEERRGRLRLIVAPNGDEGALRIHQDARLYTSILDAGQSVEYPLQPGRGAWIQVARGAVEVNGLALNQGDGAAIEDERSLSVVSSAEGSEILLFDLN